MGSGYTRLVTDIGIPLVLLTLVYSINYYLLAQVLSASLKRPSPEYNDFNGFTEILNTLIMPLLLLLSHGCTLRRKK